MKKEKFLAFVVLFLLLSLSRFAFGEQGMQARADRLFTQGKYREAIVLYRSALSSPSGAGSTGILHTRVGDSYFQLGDYKNALEAYRSALKDQRHSERPQTRYWIGFSLLMLGKDAEAVTEFMKIPADYPDAGIWVSTAYYWAARASERMGRKEQASEFYRKAGGDGKAAQERFALKKAEAVKQKSKKQGPGSRVQGPQSRIHGPESGR